MCDLTKGFKLCTCADKKLDQADIDWQIQRKDNSLPIQYRKGRAAIPNFTQKEEELKTIMLDYLNQGKCFDFDYQPQEDDFLKIRISKENYRWAAFRFGKNKWAIDTSTSLDGWRSQLTNYGKGKITQE